MINFAIVPIAGLIDGRMIIRKSAFIAQSTVFAGAILAAALTALSPAAARTAKATGPVPLTAPGSWLTEDDYPASAMHVRDHGLTVFALAIDAQGRVSSCRITASSGSAILDEATCRLITERGRFTPARDARGRAVPGQFASRVRWQFDPERAEPIVAWRTAVALNIARDGTVLSCTIERSALAPAEAKTLCPPDKDMVKFLLSSMNGEPHKVLMEFSFTPAGKAALPLTANSAGREVIFLAKINLDIGVDGSIEHCTLPGAAVEATPDTEGCNNVFTGPFQPYIGASGQPEAIKVVTVITASIARATPAKP
jgi:TonB family protein